MIWNESTDVIIVGCGFAGATAAIAAHDAGAEVVLLEKMPDPGGISICSGGGLRIASDAQAAFTYLQATNAGTTPDDVLQVLATAWSGCPMRLNSSLRSTRPSSPADQRPPFIPSRAGRFLAFA